MAHYSNGEKYGYEDSRFKKDIDESFYCSICYNVFKEPRMCRNNEHIFCRACITQHLNVNAQTCPECNDDLSIDTLRRPPRVVNNYLSRLNINCDYASRGCPVFTSLEQLQTHVENCGYAPVLCSNTECGMVVNKQDKVHHESEVCEYRKVKCHDCGQIQDDMRTLKGSLTELNGKVEKTEKDIQEVKEMNKEIYDKVEHIRENISQVNKDVDEVKTIMTLVLEKLNTLEQLDKSLSGKMLNLPRDDILIAGGSNAGKSVEIFLWEKNCWTVVASMNEEHTGASSVVYKDQLLIVGGGDTRAIDSTDLNEVPLTWRKLDEKLPGDWHGHQNVVFQESVLHIGGYDVAGRKASKVIGELQLAAPCMIKELCQMPKPRESHSAQVFEDKVLILGGYFFHNPIDSVLEFDPKRNECKEKPKLPFPLKRMATVLWRDEVVVIGGCDKDANVLNAAFMYNCKTGLTRALPSMLEKRCWCCAVITGNTIVVMGGRNEESKLLNSVECFRIGSSTWEYLPDMNKPRCRSVAEVLPSKRKNL